MTLKTRRFWRKVFRRKAKYETPAIYDGEPFCWRIGETTCRTHMPTTKDGLQEHLDSQFKRFRHWHCAGYIRDSGEKFRARGGVPIDLRR